ncbi:MAG TPA: glycosyltransferase, partial [Thiobacillus sp.]|nr:glycosyltransferase [Thiobacillus sp.]
GPARGVCQALLQQAGLAHLAWLPGERDDIAEIMRAFDVFVLPSKNEGISNTVLEAQASGLPVIATAVGGNVELVKADVNGMLVAPGDINDMAQALLGYLDSPARIAEHGGQARRQAEQRFSIAAMAEAYARVYDRTLGRRQAA